MTDSKYALVQHTGYTQTQHAEFAHAVETRSVTPAVAKKIKGAGGLVFDSYGEASDAEEAENYPAATETESFSLTPRARGIFRHVPGVGEPVYVPYVLAQVTV